MKLIVGLGNPGKEYEKTRHNAGFLVIDKLLDKLNIKLDKEKFESLYTIYNYKGDKVFIVKPLTYMNNSGEAVLKIMNYYDIDIEDLIVIHDDLDLPVGYLRLRRQGSSGGQKGMESIIKLLGSQKINRIRLGISNNKNIDTKDYVLGKMSKEETKVFDEITTLAADALIYSLDHDFDLVMSKYNKRKEEDA